MQWKFNVIVVILLIASESGCRATKSKVRPSSKFTIEELLSTTFPYSDPRTDSQLDMDPCKAGKNLQVLPFQCSLSSSWKSSKGI